jgi:hypothetical protein
MGSVHGLRGFGIYKAGLECLVLNASGIRGINYACKSQDKRKENPYRQPQLLLIF